MKKKRDLTDLAANPEFIPGISNYCDRWCERCAFTARCLAFALESQEKPTGDATKAGHGQFWKTLEASLQLTREMLSEMAADHGPSLNDPSAGASTVESDRLKRRGAAHPLARAAAEYAKGVDRWFQDEKQLLFDKEAELRSKAELGLGGLAEEIAGLTEIIEVIRWYQHFIHVKLRRALRHGDEPLPDETQSHDANGSVKVALIAMDHSIAAWNRLREVFPDRTDEILTELVQVDRLRRATEAAFPQARAFARPGLDSEEP